MNNTRLFTYIVVGMWGAGILGLLAWFVWCARRGYSAGTHEGATLDSTVVLHRITDEDELQGRHHKDTVVTVPANYNPHIGRRLIARETNTQRIEYPR